MTRTLLCLLLIFLPAYSLAEVFRNAYVSFELPSRWKCVLEETEWVCRSQFAGKDKEAIIILTAKEVGPNDSLQEYNDFLKKPRTLMTRTGSQVTSKVFHNKYLNIGGQNWVSGFHLGSEIPSYYTRYLATVKDRIAILVTFSAHQTAFTRYGTDFNKAIESLKVVADRKLFDKSNLAGQGGAGTGTLGHASQPDGLFENSPEPGIGGANQSSKDSKSHLFIGFGILLAIGAYFYWKSGQKNKPKF